MTTSEHRVGGSARPRWAQSPRMLPWWGFGIGYPAVVVLALLCGRVLAEPEWCRADGPTATGAAEPAGTPAPNEVAR